MSAPTAAPWPDGVGAIQPTAAILCAEDAPDARWCCPFCGGLNRADTSNAGAGYCQHDTCVSRRHFARTFLGIVFGPEMLFPAFLFDGRDPVFA
jgi:hypothetical protein